jgi:hypothetical protein
VLRFRPSDRTVFIGQIEIQRLGVMLRTLKFSCMLFVAYQSPGTILQVPGLAGHLSNFADTEPGAFVAWE